MVQVYDVLNDVKTNACAGFVVLCLEEGFEDTFTVFLTDAYAIVGNGDAEMFAVGLHLTTQPHIVLGVFVSIRKQVAHNLGYRFLVDNGGKVLVDSIYSEPFATLFEGGGEACADRQNQVMDILWCKVHAHALLFHLAEVEQLVDEFQQTVSVSVYHP